MTKRLNAIVSKITKCKVFADVGCDHGFIAEAACKRGLCEHVVITDISKDSLLKAKTLLLRRGYSFTAYRTDGLKGVCEPIDECAICGMGGYEIRSVLQGLQPFRRLIVQPMRDAEMLRTFLTDGGYRILEDVVIKSGKLFYVLITAVPGADTLDEKRLLFGSNLDSPTVDFQEYLIEMIAKYRKILTLCSREKYGETAYRLKRFEEALACLR